MKYFKDNEFADNINLAHPLLLNNLDALREYLGVPINPSPVKGSLARLSGSKTSQHYAHKRLSTACDVFIDANKFYIYSKILRSNLFNGIGLYFDTYYKNKPHMMVHLDIRDNPLLWFRDISYHYYSDDFYHNLYKYLKD